MLLKRRFIFPLAVALLVSGSSSRLPAQSSTPVLAIVGARVVDGSGNEPFAGTIVVRDGRIAEVGRNVRPPDGARTVDARGRTVTPGLIDVRVQLPAGATDDALARLFAAYLYAGVTSIGVANLDEAKVDALRDHLSIAKIKAPKLIAAGTPAGAMLASTLGSSVPDASALADLKKRNATFVPELLSAAQGDKKIALDRLRAAQQAGVRIAVGSNGSGAAGASTVREIGLLVEGGLTPLQALTAATSGSAWALGLQSDRAFLAVGQRGDLVIWSGEPSAGSGDATLIDQVFVGGEEVDRAALNAIITRPEPTPPSPTTAATPSAASPKAAGRNNTTSAEAGSSTAANTASTATSKLTAAAGKAAARAGKKGRTRSGTATTTSAAESAPEPSASTTETANANTSPPAATEAATPSTAAGTPAPPAAPSGTSAAPATPNHSTMTPPRPATAPGATAAPVAPAAVSPPAANAAAGGGAAAPVPVGDPMIDDFESGGDRTNLGPTWNASNDAGSSADVIVGRVVRGLRDHALHLTARMGDTADPYVRITVAMAHDGHPADVSQFHGLRFDARGQGRYRVVFVTRSVTDGRYHESFFSGSPLWTPVNIPFGTLGQTGAGPSVKWTGSDLLEIAFQITRDPGQMGWLELDNVRFY